MDKEAVKKKKDFSCMRMLLPCSNDLTRFIGAFALLISCLQTEKMCSDNSYSSTHTIDFQDK